MINLRENTANIEIVLAIAGASGMIFMVGNPAFGEVLMGAALSLLLVLYLLISIMPPDPEAYNKFQVILNRINFMASACVVLLMLILLFYLPGRLAVALPALALLAVCIALNAAHRHIYGIKEKGHYFSQARLLLLAGVMVIVLLWGP